jgi:hypothetical protein
MASIINRGVAENLIQQFRTENKAAGGPALLTENGDFVNGYFIDRASLEAILSNASFAGIHVYLAKHPNFDGKPGRNYTIVLAGSEPAPEGSATPYISTGDIYEYMPPCPPICSDL